MQTEPLTAAARLPWWKRLLFSLVMLLLVLSTFAIGEVGYRKFHGIPLIGGRVYQADSDDRAIVGEELALNPAHQRFLSMYKRSENDILFYEPRPLYADHEVSINSHGFRDREVEKEKPEGVFRVAVLGDSIVWGHGLRIEESFAKQLERLLTDTLDHPLEVLNFGVSGYSTQQEVEFYRTRAAAFDPDLVVVGYCLNDFKESSAEAEPFKRLYFDIFSKSYLADEIAAQFNHLAHNWFGVAVKSYQTEVNVREQFELLQEYTGDRRNVVVIFPHFQDFDRYMHGPFHESVHRATSGLNYLVVDLLAAYGSHDPDTLIQKPRDRTHPNAMGTHIAARATFDALLTERMIPLSDSTDASTAHEQSRIGMRYALGQGLPQSPAKAAAWLRPAAEAGVGEAQRTLAVLLARGTGVDRDLVAAYKWFSLAGGDRPDGDGRWREELTAQMTAQQIEEAERQVRAWGER